LSELFTNKKLNADLRGLNTFITKGKNVMNYGIRNVTALFILFFVVSMLYNIQAQSQLTESSDTHPSEQNDTITIELPGLAENANKLEMILIEPGTFTMGSLANDPERHHYDWPQHEVTLSKPFYMGKFEVTQAQWEAVMGSESHKSKYRPRPDNPVEKVSWIHCQLFIRKLNQLGQGTFRLPTEAEWEYACRAGTGTRYFFGDTTNNADHYMWWSGNNFPEGTKEVGLKQPNPWGLYDMHGNVSEWCSDRFVKPYERAPFIDQQKSPSALSFILLLRNRPSRGGGFRSDAQGCRAAARFYEQSIDFHYSMGLRLVR